ncbi:MAG: FtsX-like permease family protein [Candidatus Eremiobacteraeota bacterium]|nr:FtsX-like permease family protein [Candidatus Eremiobacteraeota bacterium]
MVDGFAHADFWMVLQPANRIYVRSSHYASAVGRLRHGVTVTAAAADVQALFARLETRYPMDDPPSTRVHVQTLHDALFGSVRPLLYAIFAAAGGVLLIACANVANLLLGRAATRDRELGIRVAVGASRRRILAQLLTETFVLAACGGGVGLLLAYLAVGALVALHPASVPRAQEVTLDGVSALYTLGIVAFCTLAAGLAPALTLSSHRLADALKASGHGSDARRGARARAILAPTEIALALALVITAGLAVRSYLVLTHETLGFNPRNVLVSHPVAMYGKRYESEAEVLAFYDGAMRRTRRIPGVRDAEWADATPFMGRTGSLSFKTVGRSSGSGNLQTAGIGIVGLSFFRVLGVALLRGRTFERSDGYAAARVVVVNEALAKTYFRERPILGAHISWNFALGTRTEVARKKPVLRTIVGVVHDTRDSYARPGAPKIYLPFPQVPLPGLLLVADIAPHAHVGDAIARAVTAADPLLAAPKIQPLDDFLAADAARAHLSALTLVVLSFVAFSLALAGIYAVVSYGVARRTHEFGIRIAVGARATHVLRDVLGGAVRIAALGILAGIVLGALAARAIAAQLYEVGPFDPLTFGVVVAAMTLAALAAALVPAWYAMRVEPIAALRYE